MLGLEESLSMRCVARSAQGEQKKKGAALLRGATSACSSKQ